MWIVAFLAPASAQDIPTNQVGAHVRMLSVPSFAFNKWLYDEDPPTAGGAPDRPKVHGMAFGAQYTLKSDRRNLIFYGEYIVNQTDAGYFDDVDDPIELDDGQWVDADGWGAAAVGVNVMHEVPFVEDERADFVPSLLLGGGIGFAIPTKKVDVWRSGFDEDVADPQCLPTAPAFERYDTCDRDDTAPVPAVIPILDLGLSMRFLIAQKVAVHLDAGLHNAVSWGGGLSYAF